MLNRYAVNEAPVNGGRTIYGEGAAQLTVDSGGALAIGLRLAGSADTEVQASGTLNAQYKGEGGDEISLAASLPPMVRVPLSSEAEIEVLTNGGGYKNARPDMDATVAIEAEGAGVVVPPASATFHIEATAGMDARVTPAAQGEANANVIILSSLLGRPRRTVKASASALFFVSAWGSAKLTMLSPPATASISFGSKGDARKGARLQGEGNATLKLVGTGKHHKRRQVYGEGMTASVRILASDSASGLPPIPEEYKPAPRDRTFLVAPSAREFSIPKEKMTA